MPRVAITGHTKGIGCAISKHYETKGYQVQGFSRSNGWDISLGECRLEIVKQSFDADIFVNNAMVFTDNSQALLLKEILKSWEGLDKIIINVSSISGDFIFREMNSDTFQASKRYGNHWPYALYKHDQDKICNGHVGLPWLINLRPGLTDTEYVKHISAKKIPVESIDNILNFIHSNDKQFKITSISFIP